MMMEHYLCHTDYPIWKVIQNGNGSVSITTDTNDMIKVLHPKTEEEVVARERERKARTTFLMDILEHHLAKFHKMGDAKEMWEAIKSSFYGNDESKKMQKYLLKQQFKGFFVSSSEGLHKGYDRFQTLLSQLEIHGASVSYEDANQKFLRSLPSFWSQVALIMRTKLGLDTLSFDDLYNNLRVFERDVKGTIASSSNTQNVAFGSSSYTDEVIHSFFVNQSSAPQLDCDDLEQINDDDLKEIDLKWQVAMISMSIKKFYKRTGKKLQFDTKDTVGFDNTKVECFNCHKIRNFARDCRAKWNQDSRRREGGYNGNKARDNGRRPAYQDDSKALVTMDGEDIDWSRHVEEDTQYFAMMAYFSNNSGFDNEVQTCSKTGAESYARLKKLYNEQRDKLGDASVEITAYTLALKKVKAQLLYHQQNQLAYDQKIKFMKIDLDDKTDVLTYHKKLLAEALKEKEDLKTKVENWQNSSKNLNRLLNTQMSANDKFRLGYGDYIYGSILSYENEVLHSVFMNKECDLEDTHVNDRYAKGMHVVPPLMTGNYMPSGPYVEIDYSKFTYGPKQTSADESDSKPVEYASNDPDSSVETTIFIPEIVEDVPKVVSEPKVWTDAPIIKEYESDSDDDSVSNVPEEKETPRFAFTDSVKHVKSPRENVKETNTPNHYLKIKKQDRHSHTRKGLGFTRKSCFVCGSFSHLIRDCDFHEKRMAKQAALTKSNEKGTGQLAHRPDDPHKALKDKGIVDSGCSRHMTGNKAHLADYQEFKGGSVTFGGSNRRITGKGKIKAGRLDFEDVYYVEELKHYNLFSVSQKCDKKNKVLFTDTNCLVLSPDFKLPDENQVLLKIPRQHNIKESNTRPLVRPRQFSWVYFLKSKDETTPILKDFIRQAENQFNHKVKTIRSDNGTEFKNHDLIEFYGLKGIKREYNNARTLQQNGVTERKNKTLIEAARTMLADSLLPTTFWVEAVNTACYVLNRVLVTKPQNKTPYELLTGRQPIISYLRPFGCHVTILNTIDQLGKFDGKFDSWFLVGYSLNSKAFRVYNLETKRVEDNLHVNFLENKPNVAGKGLVWMFDLDYLTNSMTYEPISIENQANKSAGPKEANNSAGDKFKKNEKPVSQVEQSFQEELDKLKIQEREANDALRKEATNDSPNANTNSTNLLNVVNAPVSAVGPSRALNDDEPSYHDDPSM
nr:ribonuclease H-like domain-containing protein [Tanacetum cinerariifolium]